jgi:broad specificity phosphatase PhoE
MVDFVFPFLYSVILILLTLFIMCPKSSEASMADGATPQTTTISPAPSRKPKTIYLIRHAESEENRRIAALSRTFKSLGKFSLPKSSDIYASTELLNIPGQVDSNVSEIGAQQIANMKEKLAQDKFVASTGIRLVAHSPLLRARQTSKGMLGCMSAGSSGEEMKVETVHRVVQTHLLLEKTPSEWTPLYYNTFIQRIADMEQWLWDQEEDTIALVGHSQFFKKMLNLDFKFGNCDVWKVKFDLNRATGTSASTIVPELEEVATEPTTDGKNDSKWKLPLQWSDLELMYACEVMSSQKTIS